MKLKRDTVLSGRYNIRALLGEGGMGVVYRAFDEQLRRMVAIKTIQGHIASDADFLRRFKREAVAISQIDHPHIVRLIDFVEATPSQPPYMVFELLVGKDLATVIAQERALDITRAVTRVLEASVAIAECHQHGYLHRDVKPSNIFLQIYNQVETVKVLDFGAVKQDEHHEAAGDDTSELTQGGFIIGTPYYWAPEQLTGKPATAKSDQYSLAVVLYEAVTGRKAFRVDKPKEDFKKLGLIQAIRHGDYTPIQHVRAEVPPELAAAIHRAMSLDPGARFPDLHAFGAALRPFSSAQAKLTWEAHFTSDAPARRLPQLSVAMGAIDGRTIRDGGLDGPTVPDRFVARADATGSTAPANDTIALTTAEVKEAAGLGNLATTTKQPSGELSRSISIVIDEASQPFARAASTPSRSASAEATGPHSRPNKPAIIVVGALTLLAAVFVASFFLSHRKQSASLASPPPELINQAGPTSPRPATSVPSVGTGPQRATQQPPQVRASENGPAPALPSPTPPPPAAAEPVHRKHHPRKKAALTPLLDPHGIPIPTE